MSKPNVQKGAHLEDEVLTSVLVEMIVDTTIGTVVGAGVEVVTTPYAITLTPSQKDSREVDHPHSLERGASKA